MTPDFYIEHIGFVTNNLAKFESFWCDLLGYKCIHESCGSEQMMKELFGASEAVIKRYQKEGLLPDIEIHYFQDLKDCYQKFQRFGMNHICLHTGGPGSREVFIHSLPDNLKVHVYDNPRGWENIFMQDYEGNWIELRERIE